MINTSVNDSATVKTDKKKLYAKPRIATILSIVLPGAGQAYNKKYWKIPIIYAGLGGFGYMFVQNNTQYNYYRKNLIAEYDDDPETLNTSIYSGDQLIVQKAQYRKLRDFGVIGIGAFYLLNIVDANVDAHLTTFDVSDDLSLNIAPWNSFVYSSSASAKLVGGLSIKINFK